MVDPKIGGVLISGPRGSAKTTLVRSLSGLLPKQPLCTLPLGASEEMVTGSLQLDTALKQGDLAFAPGILARANGGLLYVDEVNLLPDHLVDLLLDAAASGINQVERDGISHQHEAQFTLIGTMNPDEGELRPQLLDRFGLMANVQTDFSLEQRQEIVAQRLAFDDDPITFSKQQAKADTAVTKQLAQANKKLLSVSVNKEMMTQIAHRCQAADVDGLRADIVFYRASRAHAALQGKAAVDKHDLDVVQDLVLAHRRNEQFSPPPPPTGSNDGNGGTDNNSSNDKGSTQNNAGGSSIEGAWGALEAESITTGEQRLLPINDTALTRARHRLSSFTQHTTASRKGAHRSARWLSLQNPTSRSLHWYNTLSDADNISQYQADGTRSKLHFRSKQPRAITLNLVLLDTSASTLSGQGLAKAKGVIKLLSKQSYLKREQLSIITFGSDRVQTLLKPQRAPKNIQPLLDQIHGGGGTPLAKALSVADNVIAKMQIKQVDCKLTLLTDGRVQGLPSALPTHLQQAQLLLVDLETNQVKLARAEGLAHALQAQYVHIDALTAV